MVRVGGQCCGSMLGVKVGGGSRGGGQGQGRFLGVWVREAVRFTGGGWR